MTDTATPAPPAPPSIDTAVGQLVSVLQGLDRPDLVERATAASARLKRPATVVCVVGEFKQGKSSLVNGLLGQQVCPVDDDLATAAITLLRFGEEPAAAVRRRVDGKQVAERIAIDDLGSWVTEAGNPGNEKGVERVEIAVPSALLRQGLVMVDTPGMGGLGAGHAAATLSFLPFADGLILTSDASAELSAPEVEFLRRATELCPTVLFVQTKIDLYPSWQRIFDINKGHLERGGVRVPMVAASSSLRLEALARKDRALNERSQFPELVKALDEGVVTPAKASAAERSRHDVKSIADMVRGGLLEEQRMLTDPNAAREGVAEFQRLKERLDHLRGPGARWNVLVGDRVGDVSSTVTHQFRGAMRNISRQMDEQIENLTKGDQWDEMTRELQTLVAEEVTKAFVAVEEARAQVRAEVIELLDEEDLSFAPGSGRASAIDVSDLWQSKTIEEQTGKAKKAFTTAVTGIRGAQGGIYMFGMLGSFLPAAATVLIASNPVLLSAGAIFGGMQLMDDRKRKLTTRRQAARGQVRQFLDDVQFEVGDELTKLLRDLQRDLRDEFTERLGELQRTYTDAAKRAQEDAQRDQAERKQRVAQVDAQIKGLAGVDAALAAAAAAPAPAPAPAAPAAPPAAPPATPPAGGAA